MYGKGDILVLGSDGVFDNLFLDEIVEASPRIYISLSLYVYIYIYIYTYTCIHIYIYVEREREREMFVYKCIQTMGAVPENIDRCPAADPDP